MKNLRPQQFLRLVQPTCLLLVLGSCGGTSDGYVVGIDGSGDSVPTVVTGPVNAFGSVIVNGIRFDTSSAQILVQNIAADEALLQVGDIVTVTGFVDADGDAFAELVFQRGGLTGEVEWIDIETQQIGVMDQTVQLTQDTILGDGIFPAAISGLELGSQVNVSGFNGADGLFVATRLELAETTQAVLSGPITGLDLEAGSLSVRGVQVSLAALPLQGLQKGQWVSLTGQSLPDGGFAAQSLITDPAYDKAKAPRSVEVYGVVEPDEETGDLRIGGLTVTAQADELLQQLLEEQAQTGQEIRVRGVLDGQQLNATEASVQQRGDTSLAGNIQAVELDGQTGSLTVDGTTFAIVPSTRLAGPGGKRFDLGALPVGAPVVVSGYRTAEGWTASSIQTSTGDSLNKTLHLQGTVEDVAPELGSFYLSNTEVLVDEATALLQSNQELSREEFFALLPGARVMVQGTRANNVFRASQVRLLSGGPMN